jgi:hypothetical protein
LPSYRIFRLDTGTGKREPGEWLEANDDDTAMTFARELADEARYEVWLQDKLVGITVPTATALPSPSASSSPS